MIRRKINKKFFIAALRYRYMGETAYHFLICIRARAAKLKLFS